MHKITMEIEYSVTGKEFENEGTSSSVLETSSVYSR